ncbi:MAG: hypothetical protein OEW17_02505 [Gemmatimonadota bacterium]|nr:hypothetical protein [Gemmatimonadota bacterium]MDH4347653.1 hypothetical protein [Gemmatimonadota bacterium]MDH5282434.1 hypothetical protein [Gemmatimonadota bacterium]
MKLRPLSLLAIMLLALPAPRLQGQGRADQARLMFSLAAGWTTGGGTLWSVGKQPLAVMASEVDTLTIGRDFRDNFNLVFSGTYFPGDHLGFTAEVQLLGLGTVDACSIRSTQGAAFTSEACSSIQGSERSSSSTAIAVGVMYRVASHSVIHPYLRATGGMVIVQESFLKTTGTVTGTTGGAADLILYDDDDAVSISPYIGLGAGVVAATGRGFQLRFEVRDNWVNVPAVSGPTSRQGFVPPSERVGKHRLTATIGFDVVLERKRGRRY